MSRKLPALQRAGSHDYESLVRRWRAVARKCGLQCKAFAEVGGLPVFLVGARLGRPRRAALYLSAGIHGDEPAATEGLVEWAENSSDILRTGEVLIFPCLNPWGLINNSRLDARGRDLNRCYRQSRVEPVRSQKRMLAGWSFEYAACLHEDYDGRGVYVYEADGREPHMGEQILRVASRHLPLESRTSIEGSPCHGGLVRRSVPPELLETLPEAIYLHEAHSRHTITLETPSEFHLDDRVAVHKAVLDELAALARLR